MLGNILGPTVATAETNYTATMSNSTLKGPDFVNSVIQDAMAATLVEIVEMVAATPFHPERGRYADTIASVTSGTLLANTGAGGARVVGIPGRVIDSSDSIPLIGMPLDKVRSFNRFSGSVYGGKTEYWFAFYDKAIYHTRAAVTIGVCAFDRPTSFTGNINIGDQFENMLINGTVRRLSPKEGMYQRLWDDANTVWQEEAARIIQHGSPEAWGMAQGAPSTK